MAGRWFNQPEFTLLDLYAVSPESRNSSMIKYSHIHGITVKCSVCLVAVTCFVSCSPEPTFEGKSLSSWKAILNDHDPATRYTAAKAVLTMAPNDKAALPVAQEYIEKEILPRSHLLVMAVQNAGPTDPLRKFWGGKEVCPYGAFADAIEATFGKDPWGNRFDHGDFGALSPLAMMLRVPYNGHGCSFIRCKGPSLPESGTGRSRRESYIVWNADSPLKAFNARIDESITAEEIAAWSRLPAEEKAAKLKSMNN